MYLTYRHIVDKLFLYANRDPVTLLAPCEAARRPLHRRLTGD